MRKRVLLTTALFLFVACSGSSEESSTSVPTSGDISTTEAPAEEISTLRAGASSASILPTFNGSRAYLDDAPSWDSANEIDPNDIGVFVPTFDQGSVDVGNGNGDGSWVHDDIRASALVLDNQGQRVILVSVDVYMIFSSDADEIIRITRQQIGSEWADVPILINATHNHHGPDTAFSINADWYQLMAEVVAEVVTDAIATVQPALAVAASGEHRFGVSDGRDPIVFDPRLNVLQISAASDESVIATVVQWNSHPESTLGWDPPEVPNLAEICTDKGWDGDSCSADGRYFTADYPGVLQTRLKENFGGEVLYMNGALGSQIGPGEADVWEVTDTHPVGNGWTAPDGAPPVAGCDNLRCRNMARTEAIGEQLTIATIDLLESAQPITIDGPAVMTEEFFSQLTNIGFRLLIADGDLGWQPPPLYTCTEGQPYSDETCVSAEGVLEDDPILTPLTDSQITVGDVLKVKMSYLDLGSVGFLYMPGELPPELVIGLPADFDTDSAKYYLEDLSLHAVGIDYDFPGYLMSLTEDDIVFTVGLGGEELGYWVPISEYRLKCLEIALPSGATCADLFARGLIEQADSIGGLTCRAMSTDATARESYEPDDLAALMAICRYGQALGRELGEPEGHYEETNAAGWNLVDDLWAAATRLFGKTGTGRINPNNPGFTIQYPPVIVD